MRFKILKSGILSLFVLTACAGIKDSEPEIDYATKEHILSKGDTSENQEEIPGYFAEWAASAKDDTDPAKAQKYLVTGLALSHEVCIEWLDGLSTRHNNFDFGLKIVRITALTATGVLALTGAHSDAFQGVALGTAFIDASAKAYTEHYLLGPDRIQIRELLEETMKKTRNKIAQIHPQTYLQAFEALNSFSEVCTAGRLASIIRTALSETEVTPNLQFVVSNIVSDEVRSELASKIEKESALTYDEITALYWVFIQGFQNADDAEFTKKMLSDELKNLLPQGNYGGAAAAGDSKAEDRKTIIERELRALKLKDRSFVNGMENHIRNIINSKTAAEEEVAAEGTAEDAAKGAEGGAEGGAAEGAEGGAKDAIIEKALKAAQKMQKEFRTQSFTLDFSVE